MNVWRRWSVIPCALSFPSCGVKKLSLLWICVSSRPRSSTKIVTMCGRQARGTVDGGGGFGRTTGLHDSEASITAAAISGIVMGTPDASGQGARAPSQWPCMHTVWAVAIGRNLGTS